MALQIYDKQYTTGDDGYNALVADLKEIYPWDTIDAGDGYTDLKIDRGNGATVALRVSPQASCAPAIKTVFDNGTNSYAVNSIGDTTKYFLYNIRYAVGKEQFVCLGTQNGIGISDWISVFGVAKSINQVTCESGKISFAFTHAGGSFYPSISGLGRVSTNRGSAVTTVKCPYDVAVPLFDGYSYETAEDILVSLVSSEAAIGTAGKRTFNGKTYYKQGCLLIPEE
jgi:hypothetical protein